MKLLHLPGVLGLVVAAGLASGCDRSPRIPRAQRSTTVTLDDLPELADPIGPLDGQRIEVAPPKGWHVPSQSHRWIVRFTASEQLKYPTILVTAGDYEGLSDVSKANAEEFARQIAGAFETEKSSTKQTMTITPIEIGRFVGVSYRRRGKAPYGMKEIVVERLLLDTVVAGRKYTIELRTRDGDLDRFQHYLFAVAAGIKFLQPESGGESQQPDAGSNSEPSEEDAV